MAELTKIASERRSTKQRLLNSLSASQRLLFCFSPFLLFLCLFFLVLWLLLLLPCCPFTFLMFLFAASSPSPSAAASSSSSSSPSSSPFLHLLLHLLLLVHTNRVSCQTVFNACSALMSFFGFFVSSISAFAIAVAPVFALLFFLRAFTAPGKHDRATITFATIQTFSFLLHVTSPLAVG